MKNKHPIPRTPSPRGNYPENNDNNEPTEYNEWSTIIPFLILIGFIIYILSY